MYLSDEEKKYLVKELARYFYKPELRNFVEKTSELYAKYGENTAEEIMQLARSIIISKEYIDEYQN
ncbi:hypothetical protein [Priestia aryabhattai]